MIDKKIYIIVILLLLSCMQNRKNPFTQEENSALTISPSSECLSSHDTLYVQEGDSCRFDVALWLANLFDSVIVKFSDSTVLAESGTSETYDSLHVQVSFPQHGSYMLIATGYLQNGPDRIDTFFIRVDGFPVSIKTQPEDQTVILGERVVFRVEMASGSLPVNYQWYKDTTAMSDAVAESLLINAAYKEHEGLYFCILDNGIGNPVETEKASLTIIDTAKVAPRITAQPNNANVMAGEQASFSVSADGTNLIYQWQKDSADIDSADSSTYTILSALLADSGSLFRCIVSNLSGSDTSENAILSVADKPSYAVEYLGNGNSTGEVPVDSSIYEPGAIVQILSNTDLLEKSGYTFVGWNAEPNDSGKSYIGGDTLIMGQSDVVLYARWTQNPTYTVAYLDNESTGGNPPVDENNYESGAQVTVLANTGSLARTGFTFIGWNTMSEGSGKHYVSGDTLLIGSTDIVLYAQWTQNPTYTVIYIGNGSETGSVPLDVNNYEAGAAATVKGNVGALVRTGYSFKSWCKDQAGTGKKYVEGDSVIIGAGNVTLFAFWSIDTFTVKFESNGGSAVDSQRVIYNSLAIEPSPSPGKTGYTFAGWHISQALTTEFDFAVTPIVAPRTLYAKWTGINYIVTFNANSGMLPNPEFKTVAYGSPYGLLATTSRAGYAFQGWWTGAGGTGTQIDSASTMAQAEDHTLYAKWSPNTYAITFYKNDEYATGLMDKQFIVTGGSAPLTSNAFARGGRIFAGWATTSGGAVAYVEGEIITMGTADVDLYAKWEIRDGNGNVYTAVIIGNQEWTAENMRATKYMNGTDIPHVAGGTDWYNLYSPGYCFYDTTTNPQEQQKWGALYNWYAVNPANTQKIAPTGWRVPTDADWTELENYLIANRYNYDSTTTGNKIAKALAAKTDWATNTGIGAIGNNLSINNASNFSALPGGQRFFSGSFSSRGNSGIWWSATDYDAASAYYRSLSYNSSTFSRTLSDFKKYGYSIRLVRNLN